MNLYIYSDESGVFDNRHYRYFTFGGVLLLGEDEKEKWSRKYAAAEKSLNAQDKYGKNELKAARLSAKDKNKLFRSLNQCQKFAVVIDMSELLPSIFEDKKVKQRYLDYAYWTGCKYAIWDLIEEGIVKDEEIEKITFLMDDHSTATYGRYELQQQLEEEFILGNYNYDFSSYYPPALTHCRSVSFDFLDSKTKLLIRASDIVANKVLYSANND